MSEDARRVQFSGGGHLSMTLISTDQPTFTTGASSKHHQLDDGTRLRADTLKEPPAQSTFYPHFAEFMGVRHVKERHEIDGVGDRPR